MAAKEKTKKAKTVKKVNKVAKKTGSNKLDKLTKKVNSLRAKKYFPVVFVLLILLTVAYFGRSLLFAALVGGRPISRVKLISELEKQGGQQTLESLITKELVTQEAQRKSINVTDVDISSEIQKISDLLDQQGSNLDAALSMQGQTKEDLEENIRLQKTVEKLLADSISVSDDEIQKYFDDNKTYYGEDVNFEDIKDSIKDQIAQEKLSSEFPKLLERLKSEGNIIYFVDFE